MLISGNRVNHDGTTAVVISDSLWDNHSAATIRNRNELWRRVYVGRGPRLKGGSHVTVMSIHDDEPSPTARKYSMDSL